MMRFDGRPKKIKNLLTHQCCATNALLYWQKLSINNFQKFKFFRTGEID